MDKREKLKILQSLNEERLTKEFIIPLFENMGFKNVKYNHGVLEYGKDVIYCEETKYLKQKYVGVQVKKGDIDTETADKIIAQITRGLAKPFTDLSDNKEKPIDEFRIILSGIVKENARENIFNSIKAIPIKPYFTEVEEFIDLLDKYMPSAFWTEYDYFNKYFDAMKRKFEEIKDISAIGQKEPIPLEDIYVSLKLSEEKKYEMAADREQRIFKDELERQKQIVERERIYDAERAVKEHHKLVIVSVPGSGKTTLLKHLALKSCKENLEKQESVIVPVYITLMEFLESGKALREYIDDVFERYKFPKAKDFIEKNLKEGKCILLLDGFDELAVKENQKKITEEIQEFAKEYHETRLLLPRGQQVITAN